MPPNTPPQRLERLQKFAVNWIDAQIATGLNRPLRAERMKTDGIGRLVEKLGAAFARPCSFFDPTVSHGGPRPVEERKRREFDFVEVELNRIQRDIEDELEDKLINIDIFDQMELAFQRGSNSVRLSSDVEVAWKQIGTAFRKWILRYIAECGGERNYKAHTNRLDTVLTINIRHYLTYQLPVNTSVISKFNVC